MKNFEIENFRNFWSQKFSFSYKFQWKFSGKCFFLISNFLFFSKSCSNFFRFQKKSMIFFIDRGKFFLRRRWSLLERPENELEKDNRDHCPKKLRTKFFSQLWNDILISGVWTWVWDSVARTRRTRWGRGRAWAPGRSHGIGHLWTDYL